MPSPGHDEYHLRDDEDEQDRTVARCRAVLSSGRMPPMGPRSAIALSTLLLCCATQRRVYVRPHSERDLSNVSFLAFASSNVEGFFDGAGRPCRPFAGSVRESFAGWWSDDEGPACIHRTFKGGLKPAALELRWQGTVPADGGYNVVSGGYALGTWGYVVARGSYYGDFWAWARVTIDVQSAHCRGSWSLDLAKAALTGPDMRAADFSGWVEIPDIRISGCKAGDILDVRVRLVGQSNRGDIAVDMFGFWAQSDDDLNRMFGIEPAPMTSRLEGNGEDASASGRVVKDHAERVAMPRM
jgi:hypothetical protein